MKLCRPKPINVKRHIELYADVIKMLNKPSWLTRDVFDKIVETTNAEIVENFRKGAYIELPFCLGGFELKKYKRNLKLVGDKIVGQPSDIDWVRTSKWWAEDAEAKANKDVLYFTQPYKFRLAYVKNKVKFRNSFSIGFKFATKVRKDIVKGIRDGVIDAIMG